MQPMKIDAELIHNWTQRYQGIDTGQLGELPLAVRAAILRAHRQHHNEGRNAQGLAVELAAQYPAWLYV